MNTNIQTINAPGAGQTVIVTVGSGRAYAFSFNIENAVVSREGDDLVITLPDGAVIILRGMVTETSAETPSTILLPDGSVVLVTDMVEKFGIQAKEAQKGTGIETDGTVVEDGKLSSGEMQPNAQESSAKQNVKVGDDLSHKRDTTPDSPDLSQRGRDASSQDGLNIKVGSGIGQFRSDAGELIEGTWALPDLGTFYWGPEVDREIIHEGAYRGSGLHAYEFSAPALPPSEYTARVTVTGSTENESHGHIRFYVTIASDAASGSTLVLSLADGSARSGASLRSLGADYVQHLEYFNGTTWQSATVHSNGTFSIPVSGSGQNIQLRVPLIDDHISEGTETMYLAVIGMLDADGKRITNFDPSSNFSAPGTILDDSLASSGAAARPHEIDGPIVSIDRVSAPSIDESAQNGKHIFQLAVKNCLTNENYAGQDNSGRLTQDITISFTLEGTATFGADYTFAPSAALASLIQSGRVTLAINPDGTGSVTLHGLYDANGNLRPSGALFTEQNLADLTFEAAIIADGVTEPLPETIRMTLTGVTGNEAQLGTDVAQGLITENTRAWGPVLTWGTGSQTVAESHLTNDAWNTVPSPFVTHHIHLDAASGGPIRVEVQITGKNGGTLYDGTNTGEADFKWADSVEYYNGSSWQPLPASGYTFDPATGKLQLTIPQGAVDVRFEMEIIDDLREFETRGEGYTLTLSLVTENGNTDGAAVLGNGSSPSAQLDSATTIEADVRNGELNPAKFDGPFVIIEADPGRQGLPVNANGEHYAPEHSGKSLPFTLSLLQPDGTPGLYADALEPITVNLKISGGDGFQLQDLFASGSGGAFSETITLTLYHANGTTSQAQATISGNGSDTAATLTVTLPVGVNQVAFDLPVNDDGITPDLSGIERPEETVTVQIVGISGNEARVPVSADTTHLGDTSATLIIADETPLTPPPPPADIRVGLGWENHTGLFDEGDTGVMMVRLYDKTGGLLTEYEGATTLPEDLVIDMAFSDTAAGVGTDLAFMLSSEFLALVSMNKVEMAIDGVPYNAALLDSLDFSSAVVSGVTLTLKAGAFDLLADKDALGFNAITHGDNINEYDRTKNYANESPASNEQFHLQITSVTGNDSAVHTSYTRATGTISDKADGELSLVEPITFTPASGSNPGGNWNVKLKVEYADGEKTNPTPGTAQTQGFESGSVLRLPGEDTTMWFRVTDSAMMQHGKAYEITAYDVFLSVNGLNSAAVSQSTYDGYLANPATIPNPNWIIVSEASSWTNVGGGRESMLFELHVPQGYWGSSVPGATNGEISFTIAQGDTVGGGGSNGFTVQLVQPPAGKDIKGEIVTVDQVPQSVAQDNSVEIQMELTGDSTIDENGANNVATYHMDFSQWRIGGTNITGSELELACDLSFKFTLMKNGTANFNDNTRDNTTYATMGDFALSNSAGDIYTYHDLASLGSAVQDLVTNQHGYAPGDILVMAGTDTAGNYTFSFTIKAGVDLIQGIDLYFVALDDNVDDSGERFTCKISEISTEGDAILAKIIADTGTTTINDEANSADTSGYALVLSPGIGYEKLVDPNNLSLQDGAGNPIDGRVHVPVYAYMLGSENKFAGGNMMGDANEGDILTLTNLLAIYKHNTGITLTEGAAANNPAFKAFVMAHFAPSQNITLDLTLAPGDAKVAVDYKSQTGAVVEHSTWELVIEGSFIYFKSELTIETINDYILNGGDLDFTVTLTGSRGNESRPADPAEVTGGNINNGSGQDLSCTSIIKDYHDGPIITGMGTVIGSSDGTHGALYEPVDTNHGSNNEAAAKKNIFTIQLDRATEQDMIIWLNITENHATPDDYYLGAGICKVINNSGTFDYTTWDSTANSGAGGYVTTSAPTQAWVELPALAPGETAYFVIIPATKSSVSFDIMVKDDNLTETNESLSFKIIAVQGGEAMYECVAADGEKYAVPWDDTSPYVYCYKDASNNNVKVVVDPANDKYYEIDSGIVGNLSGVAWLPQPPGAAELPFTDDGFGPQVWLDGFNWVAGEEAPSFNIHLEDVCQEDVTVTVSMRINGKEYLLDFTLLTGSVGIITVSATDVRAAAIANTGNPPVWTENGTSFQGIIDYNIVTSHGHGETIPNTDPGRLVRYETGNPAIWLGNLTATNIDEGTLPELLNGGYGGFTLDMEIQTGATIPPEISFTVSFPHSNLLGDDTAEVYTVRFDSSDTALLVPGRSYEISIVADVNGEPQLVVTYGGSPLGIGQVAPSGGTHLPAAEGNTIIGDDTFITASLGNPTGAGVYLDPTPGSTTDKIEIKDNTTTTVKFFLADEYGVYKLVDANNPLLENIGDAKLKAVLVLSDALGTPVDETGALITGTTLDDFTKVTTKSTLEFDIHHVDDPAPDGTEIDKDYSGSKKLRIEAGESEGEFTISVTQDDLSEGGHDGKEWFNTYLTPTTETESIAQDALGQIKGFTPGTPNEYGHTNIAIQDDNSGPKISWTTDKTSVAEDGTIVLEWESRLNGGRQVVAENVDMVFKLKPDNGFTLDEIEYIFFNGTKYTATGPDDIATILVTTNPLEWSLNLTGPLAGLTTNTGLNSLTIKLKDDILTETTETLTITLESVYGGETDRASDSIAGKTIEITDLRTGLVVDLQADAASDENAAIYYITFSSGDAPQEDATITLQLDEDSQSYLRNGGTFTVDVPGHDVYNVTVGNSTTPQTSPVYFYNTDTGTLTVTVPTGFSAGSDITVTFPIQNDSSPDVRDFSVSLLPVSDGEMSMAPGITFSGNFVQYTNPTPGVDAGSSEYKISTGSLPPNSYGSLQFDVVGIADKSVIKEMTLDGVALVEGTHWSWSDGKVVVENLPPAAMESNYDFKITYAQDADADHLSQTKLNIGIGNASLAGKSVVVPLTSDGADGLIVSFSGVAGAVEEGNPWSGNLVVAMEGMRVADTTTLEQLTIEVTISPALPASAFAIDSSLSGLPGWSCSYSAGSGKATITIPAGTTLTGGTLTIPFTADMPDNCLTINPNYDFTITGIKGTGAGAYEAYHGVGTTEAIIPNNETNAADLDGPTISITGGGTAMVGTTASFNLVLVNGINGPATLAETLSVNLQLTGDYGTHVTVDGIEYPIPAGGIVTGVSIPAGNFSGGGILTVPLTVTVDAVGSNGPLTVAITSITGGGVYEVYRVDDTNYEATATIVTSFMMPLSFGFEPDLDGAVFSPFMAEEAPLGSGEMDAASLVNMRGLVTENPLEEVGLETLPGDIAAATLVGAASASLTDEAEADTSGADASDPKNFGTESTDIFALAQPAPVLLLPESDMLENAREALLFDNAGHVLDTAMLVSNVAQAPLVPEAETPVEADAAWQPPTEAAALLAVESTMQIASAEEEQLGLLTKILAESGTV